MEYDYQKVRDDSAYGFHFRIRHIRSDSRVSTCWDETNAKLVVDALNNYEIPTISDILKKLDP